MRGIPKQFGLPEFIAVVVVLALWGVSDMYGHEIKTFVDDVPLIVEAKCPQGMHQTVNSRFGYPGGCVRNID